MAQSRGHLGDRDLRVVVRRRQIRGHALFGECKKGWLGTFLELFNGIPSHGTFGRVFAASDPKKFLEALMRWTQSLREALPAEVVAIDGKALRRAIDQGQSPKVIVSA